MTVAHLPGDSPRLPDFVEIGRTRVAPAVLSDFGRAFAWTEKIIYDFCSVGNCADGSYPVVDMIFGGSGNHYGTTHDGGATGFRHRL
jgi:hypothetical protein